jgi:hypothetical protein
LDGVLKFNGRPKGDHVTHLWNWIERFIARNSVWKCSYVDDIIEGGPMMWVSTIMDGNRQEGKWLTIKRKALKTLKWAKTNSALPLFHLVIKQGFKEFNKIALTLIVCPYLITYLVIIPSLLSTHKIIMYTY